MLERSKDGLILRFRVSRAWASHLTPPTSSWGFVFRSREDLIFLNFFSLWLKGEAFFMGFSVTKFINSYFFIRLTSHCSRVTVFRNEIATSFNQKTVNLLAMTERVDEILTSHNTLLRMTDWVNEIATSFNQKPVDLFAMTDLERLFTLILTFSHQGRRNSDSSLRGTKWRGNLLTLIFFIPLPLDKGRLRGIRFFSVLSNPP